MKGQRVRTKTSGRVLKSVAGGRMTSIVHKREPGAQSTADSKALRSERSKAGRTRYA